jgi:hypothetical protein
MEHQLEKINKKKDKKIRAEDTRKTRSGRLGPHDPIGPVHL